MRRAREDNNSDNPLSESKRARLGSGPVPVPVFPFLDLLPEMRQEVYTRLDVRTFLRLRCACRQVRVETYLFVSATWLPERWRMVLQRMRTEEGWLGLMQLLAGKLTETRPHFLARAVNVHVDKEKDDLHATWLCVSPPPYRYAVALEVMWASRLRLWYYECVVLQSDGFSMDRNAGKVGGFGQLVTSHAMYHTGGWVPGDLDVWWEPLLQSHARRRVLGLWAVRACDMKDSLFS
jgi:hypothetical protein